MSMPSLSPEQLSAAREASNQARKKRAELKQLVSSESISFSEALERCRQDDVLARIRVVDLLKAVPRIGQRRAEQIMEKLKIADGRRIRGLGRHQIEALKEALG